MSVARAAERAARRRPEPRVARDERSGEYFGLALEHLVARETRGVLRGAARAGAAQQAVRSQSFGETLEYRFEHLDTSEAFVVRLYDVPSAILGAGALDHLARCRFVVMGFGSIAVVFLGNLELFVG